MDRQQRTQYMQAMGIPVWMPKALCQPDLADKPSIAQANTQTPIDHQPSLAASANMRSADALLQSLDKKPVIDKQSEVQQAAPTEMMPRHSNSEWADWDALRAAVTPCQRCTIHQYRTQTVFGVGNPQADWMIVGEAPGADEDRQGEPFVGKAGQLLTNILAAVKLPRESVYIANVLKCRPPNNRDPKVEEIANCQGYLHRQIELVNPAVIVVVGRIAAQTLLQTQQAVGRLRGKVHQLPGYNIPLVVTYHPAYLLRQPLEKRKVWEDLKLARQIYDPIAMAEQGS